MQPILIPKMQSLAQPIQTMTFDSTLALTSNMGVKQKFLGYIPLLGEVATMLRNEVIR